MARAGYINAALRAGQPSDAFESWSLVVPAGTRQSTNPADWAGALVLIESGAIEVECRAGGSRRFVAGDLLALGWLAITTISNPGTEAASLRAVRRRLASPARPRSASIRTDRV